MMDDCDYLGRHRDTRGSEPKGRRPPPDSRLQRATRVLQNEPQISRRNTTRPNAHFVETHGRSYGRVSHPPAFVGDHPGGPSWEDVGTMG
jgi:hypothetical protein